ncbi:dihydroorotase [Desulforhopalus vacuolatus]|uniref:dihydroorotase n=1 Tax=Desulforhopalus vacuolatus TaxID=40414 RepID=UPI001964204D|nr:dihydroorotase [Desulforhopalus vacuolatus]MBM9520996.1 dihydroorotase [Desulforhopalus vacuolatus]
MRENTVTIRRPDDWHLHLRDGALLRAVTPSSSFLFGRVMIMPNLVPPVTTVEKARVYRQRVLQAAVKSNPQFQPLMGLYLTDNTTVEEIDRVAMSTEVAAVKLYPAGATTNSASGVTSITKVMPVLERMALKNIPLMVHGEVVDADIDIFDREAVFIDRVLKPLRKRLPELRIVLEHVTTKQGVDFVQEQTDTMAATLTMHHLVINRNALLVGGIKPHNYCLPVAKREEHRLALVQAATGGDPHFFFGSDSAPHLQADKESACGCAGCFTAGHALLYLAEVFYQAEALEKLEGFVSRHGASFYGVSENTDTVSLCRSEEDDNSELSAGDISSEEGMIKAFATPGVSLRWNYIL